MITWQGEVFLPAGIATEYIYVIMEGSEPVKWETLPGNRVVTPEDISIENDDGSFGSLSVMNTRDIFIEEGWLVAQSQVRIRLSNKR